MKRKPRILLCNEFSQLNTGYSVCGQEILSRLHKTNKYELAELAVFADPDQKYNIPPWKVFFNQPSYKNEKEFQEFSSRQTYAFGEWSFEKVCLDFKPDVVFDIRDFWMVDFQERSPFRKYFHWVWQTSCDSIPQHSNYISTAKNADAIFTYSDWATEEYRKYQGINVVGTASPGTDLNTFNSIQNKKHHKESRGLPGDSFIVGTVMRNQKRKLFPDLIKSFRMFLDQAPENISRKAYLFLHTSYPDWWEIPIYLNNEGVASKTFLTYKCKECGYMFVSRFQDSRCFCPKCQKATAFIPNTHLGLSREELNWIYNCFDIYVQYANCEGFGIPMVEAAAAGIPVMAVDYSAMSDVVRKLKGYPIKVLNLQYEAEGGSQRAIPDNQDLVDKLLSFSQLPEELQKRKGFQARKLAERHYNWDNTAKIWENYFDSVSLRDPLETWDRPTVSLLRTHEVIPDLYDIDSFVRWLFTNIIERPDLCDSYMFMRMSRDIQMGCSNVSTSDVFFNEFSATGNHAKRIPFGRDDAVRSVMAMAEHYNKWEIERGRSIKKD